MSRIRTIKPDFFKHEGLSGLSIEAHFLAAALLCYADDDGFFNANPKLISAECFPLREEYGSCTVLLQELSNQGFLRLGKLSDGKSIGQIVNFSTHQVINKKKNSKFKEMEVSWEEYGRSTVQLPDSYDPEWKRNGREKEKEGKGKENELSLRSSSSPSPEIQITEKPKNGKKLPEIEFDVLTGSWNKITDEDRARWRTAFPAVDIEVELAKASSWLVANPANAKSRYRRFLTSWLSRAQDRAPRTTPAKPDGHGDAWSGVKRL